MNHRPYWCGVLTLLLVGPASAADRFPWVDVPQTDGAFRAIDVRLMEAKRNLYMAKDAMVFCDRAVGPESAHVPFARPWYRARLKVLYITGTRNGLRAIVELQQRLDADVRVLYVPSGEFWVRYPNASDVVRPMLLKALDAHYDVIVMPQGRGTLSNLEPAFLNALTRKVRAGTGFVFLQAYPVRPKPDKPLVPELMALTPQRRVWNKTPQAATVADHPAVRGIPFGLIHSPGYTECTPRHGATPVIAMDGKPLMAVGRCAKGRLVTMGSLGTLSREAGMPEQNGLYYRYWEYLFALRARAVLWAAGREPQTQVAIRLPDSADARSPLQVHTSVTGPAALVRGTVLVATLYDDEHRRVAEKRVTLQGAGTPVFAFPGPHRTGLALVDARLLDAKGRAMDWASGGVRLALPAKPTLVIEPTRIRPGDKVRFSLRLEPTGKGKDTDWYPPTAVVRVRVRDAYGRLVFEHSYGKGAATWQADHPRGVLFRVTADLVDDKGRSLIRERGFLTCPKYGSDDYHNFFWPSSQSPYNAALEMALSREVGVDGLYCAPWQKFQWYAAAGDGMVIWGGNLAAVAGRAPVDGDKLRYPPLSEAFRTTFLRQRHVPTSKRLVHRFGVSHVSLQDEGHQLKETSFDDFTLGEFRKHLAKQYKTVAALNKQWGTSFADWASVRPSKTAEMKGQTNYARWLEFRRFMDSQMATQLGEIAAELRKAAGTPDVAIGVEGIFGFSNHHVPYGLYDYAKMTRAGLDAISPYISEFPQIPGGNAYDFDLVRGLGARCMTAGWINPNNDPWQQRLAPWWGVFHGSCATSYFVDSGYTSDAGAKLARAKLIDEPTRPLRHGVGKLLIQSRRHLDPVAIYFDMGTFQLAWIMARTQGKGWLERLVADGKASMERVFQDLGLTPGWVTPESVAEGALSTYRMVVLTGAAMLSRATIDSLVRFAESGGVVVADGLVGVYDETGRPAPGDRLKRLFGVRRDKLDVHLLPGQYSLGVVKRSTLFPSLPPEWMKASVLETGLVVDGASAVGAHVEIAQGPAFIEQRVGKGRTLLINSVNTTYINDADERDLNVWAALMTDARITAPAAVYSEGAPLRYYDVKVFRSGAATLAGIIRSPRFGPINPLDVDVRFGRDGFLHDVLSGQSLGRGRSARVRILPGTPALVACLPGKVAGVDLKADASVKPGGLLNVRIAVRPAGACGHTVFRLEVVRPDGNLDRALTANLSAPGGRYTGVLPLALDDPNGTWRLRVREVITHATAQATLNVR